MSALTEGQGLEILSERVTATFPLADSNGPMGFDPISIITMIISMISGCVKPTPAKMCQRLGNRAMIAVRLSQETGCNVRDGMKAANKLFDLADAASTEELQAVIDDCK